MASISVDATSLAELKKAIRKDLPDVSSSHISEAIAAALAFRTHASLLASLPSQAADPAIVQLDDDRFYSRLHELGYRLVDDEFRFDWLQEDCPPLISTMPDSGYDIEYKTRRERAWRNLMVIAINEGIRQQLFSLRPYDNRWPGAEPESSGHRGTGYVFGFDLPNGRAAKGYVGDAGFGELSIHVAANPKGDWVRTSNGGFHAGDAFAKGWLERQKGAWLQSSPDMFNCRMHLVEELAGIEVNPMGFGDKGRVIL